jgi:sortase A
MPIRKIYPEDLTVRHVHYLILERRRTVRNTRLEHFHRTGRVVPFVAEMSSIEDTRSWLGTQKEKRKGIPKLRRTWFDRILTLIELAAITGLISILVGGLSTLGGLNQTFAESFRQPALQPTPIIRAVVLPDGHTSPKGPGGARPNEREIPEHLRPLWQSLSNLPTPIPAPEQAVRIQIPAISVDAPVVQGDGWEQLKKGVGQQVGSPDPGKNGNIVLSGHNDVYGEVFRYLDRLTPGDSIILFTSQRQYTYIVTGTQMVEPTAVEVMAPTPDARVTLISCHPYLVDDHRIVVSAVLQSL